MEFTVAQMAFVWDCQRIRPQSRRRADCGDRVGMGTRGGVMKVFVLTEEALVEMILSIAEHAKTFPRAKRENYIKATMKHMAEYGTEVVFSYEEEQRMRSADRLAGEEIE
jgi:hypothetical protein